MDTEEVIDTSTPDPIDEPSGDPAEEYSSRVDEAILGAMDPQSEED